ncbi:MAG TPA: sigma-70 family RNA polymerase sigma factor [Nitrospirales bacterium]|nr:sigma-70 family RNA polymerase sigma factor [Nitrospirales bacterium]
MAERRDERTSDQALISDVASADQAAFEALYRRYQGRVYRYLRMLVQDPASAEELVLDVMVAVWKGAGSFRGQSSLSTWIFGIARNKAMDAIRHMMRKQHGWVSLEEAPEQVDSQCDLAVEAEQKSVAALTRRALASLSTEHREVIQLVFFDELSCRETAEIVGCPLNTVKTRLFYARRHLKKILQEMGVGRLG